MQASAALIISLTVALAATVRAGGASGRLTEKPINLLPAEGVADLTYKPTHTAGYFKLNRTYAAEMFYFFFEHRTAKEAPLILWMTGGPGCSSELAVFYENGPYHIQKNLTLTPNPYGWDAAGSIIFVDQPINTGFSYSEDERDRVYDEKVVAADMLDFILEFLEAHPEFSGRDFFVTGESYAGHYVPAVSAALHAYSKIHGSKLINLRGLAIGNGLTDPAIQYGAYATYALRNGLIPQSLHDALKAVYPLCKFGIDSCNQLDLAPVCQVALAFCQSTQFSSILAVAGDINVYDIRKKCIGPLCYDFSRLDDYLAQPSVRKELGVGDRAWQECDPNVYADFQGDWMKNYDNLVSPLLNDGLSVMIYEGVEDLICNWIGNEEWVEALPWTNSSAFLAAAEKVWVANGTEAGTVRAAGGLSFVKVNDAGHMSPMDQPENVLDMISHFVRGEPLDTRRPSAAEAAAVGAAGARLTRLPPHTASFSA